MSDQQIDVLDKLRDALASLFGREDGLEDVDIDAFLAEHGLSDITTHDIDACLPADFKSYLASSGSAASSAAASASSSAAAASSSSSAVAQHIAKHYYDYSSYVDRSVDYGSGNVFQGQFQTNTGDVGGDQSWDQTQEDGYGQGHADDDDEPHDIDDLVALDDEGEHGDDEPEGDEVHVPPVGTTVEDRSVDFGQSNTFDGQLQTNTGDVGGDQTWTQTQTTPEPASEPEPDPID